MGEEKSLSHIHAHTHAKHSLYAYDETLDHSPSHARHTQELTMQYAVQHAADYCKFPIYPVMPTRSPHPQPLLESITKDTKARVSLRLKKQNPVVSSRQSGKGKKRALHHERNENTQARSMIHIYHN